MGRNLNRLNLYGFFSRDSLTMILCRRNRAKVLATEFGSDAWFEDESKIVMAI
jgi:hypothetical protein